MTEKSYYWNGTAGGDAIYAPYDADTVRALFKQTLATDGGYVIPDYLNNLEISLPGGGGWNVNVASGGAFVYGAFYNSSASLTLTISENTADFPRWDRIILRLDTVAHTIRMVVLEGAPARIPDLPELNTCETELEMPLWRLYITPDAVSPSLDLIHDERKFANTIDHQQHYYTENLLSNPEFLAHDLSTTYPYPIGWIWLAGGSTAITWGTKFDSMRRGRTFTMERTAASGADRGIYLTVGTHANATEMFTFRAKVKGLYGTPSITFGSTTKRIPPTNGEMDLIIREKLTGYQDIQIFTETVGDKFRVGEITYSHGYLVSDVNYEVDDYIMFNQYIDYTEVLAHTDTGSAVMLVTRALTTLFPDGVLDGVKYLIMLADAQANASATSTNASFSIEGGGKILFGKLANDTPKYQFILMPIHSLNVTTLVDYTDLRISYGCPQSPPAETAVTGTLYLVGLVL